MGYIQKSLVIQLAGFDRELETATIAAALIQQIISHDEENKEFYFEYMKQFSDTITSNIGANKELMKMVQSKIEEFLKKGVQNEKD